MRPGADRYALAAPYSDLRIPDDKRLYSWLDHVARLNETNKMIILLIPPRQRIFRLYRVDAHGRAAGGGVTYVCELSDGHDLQRQWVIR